MLPTTHKREIKQNSNTVEEKKTHTIKCAGKKKKKKIWEQIKPILLKWLKEHGTYNQKPQ